MIKLRRYGINIPRYYGERNPDLKGKPVPGNELINTLRELQKQAEGMTGVSGLKFPIVPHEAVPFEGEWRNIRDIGVIIYIDVPISEEENMDSYLTEYKENLSDRFVSYLL